MIDWNTTRIADNYLELFVGDYTAKLHLDRNKSEMNHFKVVFEDEDGLLDDDDGDSCKTQLFAKIVTKVNDDILRAAK